VTRPDPLPGFPVEAPSGHWHVIGNATPSATSPAATGAASAPAATSALKRTTNSRRSAMRLRRAMRPISGCGGKRAGADLFRRGPWRSVQPGGGEARRSFADQGNHRASTCPRDRLRTAATFPKTSALNSSRPSRRKPGSNSPGKPVNWAAPAARNAAAAHSNNDETTMKTTMGQTDDRARTFTARRQRRSPLHELRGIVPLATGANRSGQFENIESEYAKLGTAAHELGAKAIATGLEPYEFLGEEFNGYSPAGPVASRWTRSRSIFPSAWAS
jgi:hypothetical protein